MNTLELWGGHECTLNRVGDRYRDQTIESGHQDRPEDIELFAQLGIRALRYPVLWERVSNAQGDLNWSWTDARLDRIRRNGVSPIAGLVHHGAGPPQATLLTDAFAPGLSAFAHSAAVRYPWIDRWTPVNEPLTTARFSALYGHWHPHARDERLTWIALLNQIDGVRGAMKAIRTVNSEAKLVQTEDLGRTYSTPATAHQAAFDNLRRWLTWDLLFGRVTREHPLWLRFARMGLADRLLAIADDPCPPDIIGVNHYLTSDRFLDERLERYPGAAGGGNRYMRYADVEAVRVVDPAPPSLQTAIEETWERYGTTIALTEVHNGCSREEQLRWLHEAWSTAGVMRDRGADVCAVTAWSLLGSFDWSSLLTRQAGRYEPGIFDVRAPAPRATALARLCSSLATGQPAPVGWRGKGWWRRGIRLAYAPVTPSQDVSPAYLPNPPRTDEPLLIFGATGTLGRAMARECALRGIRHIALSRRDCDLSDAGAVGRLLDRRQPWAVINAAGYVRVDDAEGETEACERDNAVGQENLARGCAQRQIRCVAFSSDLVFDGEKGRPYVEGDAMRPLNAYGRSKQAAEQAMQACGDLGLVIRTAAFFSPHDACNFATHVVRDLKAGRPVSAATCVVSPTYVPDLASAVLDLLIDAEAGVWHLANQGARSWLEFGRDIARAVGLPHRLVRACTPDDMGWKAVRPRYSALTSERGLLLPSLDDAIARFAAHLSAPNPVAQEEEIVEPHLLRDVT